MKAPSTSSNGNCHVGGFGNYGSFVLSEIVPKAQPIPRHSTTFRKALETRRIAENAANDG